MEKAFKFYTRLNLTELLGRKARTVRELLDGVYHVSASSIYYHTHRFLQQHHYLSPEPPNDFAFWVTNSLGLDKLGERLACVDTVKFRSIRELREKFTQILESYLKEESNRDVESPEGEEFHFMSCRTFIFPTQYRANDLNEFLEVFQKISVNSIYFHIFEARLRLEKEENDFSNWFKDMGMEDLAHAVSKLDPYTITLEGLRQKIIQLVKKNVKN